MYNKQKRLNFFLFLIFFLLVSCSNEEPVSKETLVITNEIESGSTPSLVINSSFTPIVVPSQTATQALTQTKTVPLTPTITDTLGPDIIKTCPEVATDSGEIHLAGVIILDGKFSSEFIQPYTMFPTYLMDLDSGGKKEIIVSDDEVSTQFSISPDHKLLAYLVSNMVNNTPDKIIIISLDGRKITEISGIEGEEYVGIGGWVNDEQLLLVKNGGYDDYGIPEVPYPLVIFDLDSSEVTEEITLHRLPDISTDTATMYTWGFLQAEFSPDFSRVVYALDPKYNEEIGSGAYGFVLRDWEKNEEIMRFESGDPQMGKAIWFSNGKEFMISFDANYLSSREKNYHFSHDLFAINENGAFERLTYFSDHNQALISTYAGTSDGRYIAFWYTSQETGDFFNLAIHDRVTKETKSYCFRSEIYGHTGAYPPVWSPNNHQLLFSNFIERGKNQLLVIDIENGIVVEVAKNFYPGGWAE
jgi:Tol biopolymer transport system component